MIKLEVSLTGPSKSVLDKELGRFVEQVMADVLETGRKYTPIRSGQARRGWTQRGQGATTTVQNSVPYIGRLDQGTSRQAPTGIIKPTLAEVSKRNR